MIAYSYAVILILEITIGFRALQHIQYWSMMFAYHESNFIFSFSTTIHFFDNVPSITKETAY